MGFHMKASNTGGDFSPCPEGAHNAVCTRLIDLGTQDSQFGPRRRVQVGFEIDELRDDGERFMVFAHMNLSMHEKASLRKFLEGWRGKAYGEDEDVDITAVVGRPALVNVVHNVNGDRTYANISGVSGLPRGMTPISPKGDTICLSLERGEFTDAEFEKLTDRMKERIQATPEWSELTNPQPKSKPVGVAAVPESDLDDDIPGFDREPGSDDDRQGDAPPW